jgi:hypothetical protein
MLNVLDVSEVRHTALHTAELLATGRSVFGAETAVGNLKSYETPDKLPAELIKAVTGTSLF